MKNKKLLGFILVIIAIVDSYLYYAKPAVDTSIFFTSDQLNIFIIVLWGILGASFLGFIITSSLKKLKILDKYTLLSLIAFLCSLAAAILFNKTYRNNTTGTVLGFSVFFASWFVFIYLFRKSTAVIKILGSLLLATFATVLPFSIVKSSLSEPHATDLASEIVSNDSNDASVHQVKSWLTNNLKDPKSYNSIDWSPVQKVNDLKYKYVVRHKYRAKNSYGGYNIEEKVFFLDANGNIVNVEDY